MLLTVNAFAWHAGVFIPSVRERRVVSANAHPSISLVNSRLDPVVEGKDLLLQGFNWTSHAQGDWWRNLEAKVPHIADAGFTTMWLPPASKSAVAPHGYTPQDLYCLDSNYGSEVELRSLLFKMKKFKIRPMADIVINHRLGTTRGVGGLHNRFEGIPMPWDEHAVTCDSGGLGNPSSGQIFKGFTNIDHTKEFVRKDIIQWLCWLRNNIGFEDFRFDYAKGFSPRYIREYIEASKPFFCVGEYWVNCNYSDGILDYNQDSHRQQIVDWVDGTDQMSTAFDFTTKGILQKAVEGEFWRLRDPSGKPPGVIGWWPSRSVTFIDNHDTGQEPNQYHWEFPAEHIMEGYAYIMTHPGIPSVFYDHFYKWGHSIQIEIVKLIKIRKDQDIRSTTSVEILEARTNLYAARVGEHLCMKIGCDPWCPSDEWTLATSGHNYAVWHK